MKSLLTTLATLIIGLTAFAHEGHDKTPGTLTAPHGGQLKGTSQLYVELVSDSAGLIFPGKNGQGVKRLGLS